MTCIRVDPHGGHGDCPGVRPVPNDIRPATGLEMRLRFSGDVNLVAICECGDRSYGDSVNDAVLAWTAHVTRTPGCREKL